MVKLDATDNQLIELLLRDARQSSQVLGKQLNLSSATVRRRLRELIKTGVVRIVAAVDPTKAGLPMCAIVAIDVVYAKLDSVMRELASRPEIKWLITTTGRFDILALTYFASADEFSYFLQSELTRIEGVRNSETFVCLHVEKGRYISP